LFFNPPFPVNGFGLGIEFFLKDKDPRPASSTPSFVLTIVIFKSLERIVGDTGVETI